MRLVEHDQVVEALTADRPDHPFSERVRLRCMNWGEHGLDPDRPGSPQEVAAIVPIAIADEEARSGTPRRRLDDLLPDPRRSRMGGDVPVHDLATLMPEQHEDVERAEGQRLHGEEVGRPDGRGVEVQEGPPVR